ncbi:hypothetical protein G6F60_014901 [Rhizopus arrhizus]|nr:hypothetical protein G6F60_014901 [Rhizopus arrhizus]
MGLATAVIRVLAEDDHLHLLERRGVERSEDLRAGREYRGTTRLALAQEAGQLAHLRLQQVITDVLLPARFQLDRRGVGYFIHHRIRGPSFNRASRSWNSTLVTSSRSSIGLSTRSLAPDCSSPGWLWGLPSPVITSTGRRRVP